MNAFQTLNYPCVRSLSAKSRDCDVWEFVLDRYYELRFSAPVEAAVKQAADNSKRRQRYAAKLLRASGIGTKSQQALQMQREERKTERKQISKDQREAEKRRQFDLKRLNRKAKHRGR